MMLQAACDWPLVSHSTLHALEVVRSPQQICCTVNFVFKSQNSQQRKKTTSRTTQSKVQQN
eukprot:4963557-Karenia_brevis.AAC.1